MKVDRVVVAGSAEGELLVLDEAVSFWGGIDSATGRIVDSHHPQVGTELRAQIVSMPYTRGSSGTSAGLTELLRKGLGPSAIVLAGIDSMLTTGSLVAARLYGVSCPIVVATLPRDSAGRWRIEGRNLEKVG